MESNQEIINALSDEQLVAECVKRGLDVVLLEDISDSVLIGECERRELGQEVAISLLRDMIQDLGGEVHED